MKPKKIDSKKKKAEFREPVIKQDYKVWIDKNTHKKLRALKRSKKKSMAQIVLDLIASEYIKDKEINGC